MIPTKTCHSCEPPTEWPLTEEYFYKIPKTSDGFSNVCRKCYKKNTNQKNKIKRKNREKIFDVNGKSKVPVIDEPFLTVRQQKHWAKDKELIIVLQCRGCGKIHEVKNKYRMFNCDCGRNLVVFHTINHLWGKIIWKNKLLENYDISKFDPYK